MSLCTRALCSDFAFYSWDWFVFSDLWCIFLTLIFCNFASISSKERIYSLDETSFSSFSLVFLSISNNLKLFTWELYFFSKIFCWIYLARLTHFSNWRFLSFSESNLSINALFFFLELSLYWAYFLSISCILRAISISLSVESYSGTSIGLYSASFSFYSASFGSYCLSWSFYSYSTFYRFNFSSSSFYSYPTSWFFFSYSFSFYFYCSSLSFYYSASLSFYYSISWSFYCSSSWSFYSYSTSWSFCFYSASNVFYCNSWTFKSSSEFLVSCSLFYCDSLFCYYICFFLSSFSYFRYSLIFFNSDFLGLLLTMRF